jgi:hypothetical protein
MHGLNHEPMHIGLLLYGMAKTMGSLQFCDLECRYAGFPKEDAVDGSRSCRTFVALKCKKKKSYVHKNLPCKDKEPRKKR